MTRTSSRLRRCWRDEGGVALLVTLMFLMLLAALSSALLGIGTSEVQIAANLLQGAEARYLADAGLQDAFNWFRSDPTRVTSAPSTLTTISGLSGPGSTLAAFGSYTVQYQSAGPNTVRVVSRGTTSGSAGGSRVVRAILGFGWRQAILVQGNLSLSGGSKVQGNCGNVHANGDLTLGGMAAVTGSATASGTYTISGSATVGPGSGGGKRPQPIPSINSADSLARAKQTLLANQIFQMKASGMVLDGNDLLITLLLSGQSFQGWTYTAGTPASWSLSGDTGYTGVYYFEGNASVSGSPPSWQTTLLATGNVEISSQPQIQTLLLNALIVADGNVTISASPSGSHNGLIAAGNAFGFRGKTTVNGVLVAQGGMVEDTVSGSPTITYNCESNSLLTGTLKILAVGP